MVSVTHRVIQDVDVAEVIAGSDSDIKIYLENNSDGNDSDSDYILDSGFFVPEYPEIIGREVRSCSYQYYVFQSVVVVNCEICACEMLCKLV